MGYFGGNDKETKDALIALAIVVVIGLVYYMYKKSQSAATSGMAHAPAAGRFGMMRSRAGMRATARRAAMHRAAMRRSGMRGAGLRRNGMRRAGMRGAGLRRNGMRRAGMRRSGMAKRRGGRSGFSGDEMTWPTAGGLETADTFPYYNLSGYDVSSIYAPQF